MKRKTLISLAIAMLLGTAGSAWAQHGHGRHDDHGRGHGHGHGHHAQSRHDGHGKQAQSPHRRDERRDDRRGAGPRRDMVKGARLHREYRGRHYVVNDWRGHRLRQPPRGHQWVQVGAEYALMAIATGIVIDIVVNR